MKKSLAYWGLGICSVLATGAIAAGLTPSVAPASEAEGLSVVAPRQSAPEAAATQFEIQPYNNGDLSSLWIHFDEEGISFGNFDANSVMLVNKATGETYYLAEIAEYDRTPQPSGSNWLINLRPAGQRIISPITVPGDYTLTIAEGLFKGAQGDVEALSWTKEIAGVPFTMAAAQEGNLKQINLHFLAEGVEFNQDGFKKTQGYLTNKTANTSYDLAGVEMDAFSELGGSNFTLTMSTSDEVRDILAGGDYELTVLAGTFTYEGTAVPQLDWSFGIVNHEAEIVPYVADNNLQTLWINFPNREIEYYYGNNMPNAMVLENTTTGAVYTMAGDPDRYTRSTKEGSNWLVSFVPEGEDEVEPILVPGEYVLHVAHGVFATFDGNLPLYMVPAFEWNWTVEGYAYEIKPQEEGNLKAIDIHFFEKGIEWFQDNNMPAARLVNTVTGAEYELAGCDRNTFSPADGSNWTMMFKPAGLEDIADITVPGSYELEINEGAFYTTDETGEKTGDVQPIKWFYNIEGIPYEIAPVEEGNLANISINFFNETVEFDMDAFMVGAAVLTNKTTGNVYELAGEPVKNTRSTKVNDWIMTFRPEGLEDVVDINEPGVYELAIKEGAYVADGEKLPVITWNYKMEGYNYNIYQTQTDNMKSLEIHFDVEGIDYFQNNNDPSNIVLTNTTTGQKYYMIGCDANTRTGLGGSNWTMHFVAYETEDYVDITTPGLYQLDIKEGSFVIFNPDGTVGQKVQSITWFKAIEGFNYTIEPRVAGDLGQLVINFPDNEGVEYYQDMGDYSFIVLKNNTTGEEYNCLGVDRNVRPGSKESSWIMNFGKDGEDGIARIIEAGNYTLSIKAGAFVVMDGEEIAEKSQNIYWSYTVNAFEYEITPVNEENLNVFNLHFENEAIDVMENLAPNAIALRNVNTGDVYYGDAVLDTRSTLGGRNFTLTFIPEDGEEVVDITAPGKYEMLIHEGAFVIYAEDGSIATKVQTLTWDGSIAGYVYNIKPYESENLATLVLDFEEKYIGYFEDNNMPNQGILRNLTTGDEYMLAGVEPYTRSENAGASFLLRFKADNDEEAATLENIIVPGQYVLEVRKGVFVAYDEEGAKVEDVQSLNWNYILNGYAYTIEPAEESNMKSLKLHFTQADAEAIVNNEDFFETQPDAVIMTNLSTAKTYELAGCDKNYNFTGVGSEFTMNFRIKENGSWDVVDITEAGIYELDVKKGYFVVVNEEDEIVDEVQPIVWEYILVDTGIENIPGFENVSFDVYGINGTVILRNADKDAVNALDKGVYIINGKRVMIR